MKNLSRPLVALVTLLLASCSTLTVHTDHDPRVNFAKYHTYAWAPSSSKGIPPSPSTVALIQNTVDQELAAKGYRKSAHPDFLIAHHVTRRQQMAVYQYTEPAFGPYAYNDWGFGPGFGYRFGYYRLWPEYPVTYTQVTPYVEGSLVVDFVDAKTRQAIWRGVASAVVGSRETNHKNAVEGIREMLAQFPPKS